MFCQTQSHLLIINTTLPPKIMNQAWQDTSWFWKLTYIIIPHLQHGYISVVD